MELWGIFDFLMPGYLGEDFIFKKKVSKGFNTKQIMIKDEQVIFTAT